MRPSLVHPQAQEVEDSAPYRGPWITGNKGTNRATTRLQNRCAGESRQAGSIPVRLRLVCPSQADSPMAQVAGCW
jgi:hypothetical protein